MILLSDRLSLLIWMIERYCCFLKVMPFDLSRKALKLYPTRSKKAYSTWFCVVIFFQIHQVFLCWRFLQTISEIDSIPGMRFTYLIMQLVYVTAFMIPTVFQFTLLAKRDEVLGFYNHYISYFMQFDRKLWDYFFKERIMIYEI